MPKNSDKIIEKAIIKYWRESVPQDVIVFFYQKYAHDSGWDFCQGQTYVKDIIIVPLKDVTLYYVEHAINK